METKGGGAEPSWRVHLSTAIIAQGTTLRSFFKEQAKSELSQKGSSLMNAEFWGRFVFLSGLVSDKPDLASGLGTQASERDTMGLLKLAMFAIYKQVVYHVFHLFAVVLFVYIC